MGNEPGARGRERDQASSCHGSPLGEEPVRPPDGRPRSPRSWTTIPPVILMVRKEDRAPVCFLGFHGRPARGAALPVAAEDIGGGSAVASLVGAARNIRFPARGRTANKAPGKNGPWNMGRRLVPPRPRTTPQGKDLTCLTSKSK